VHDLDAVTFDEKGLIPCVVQEWRTGEVLMLAYMNRESLALSLETGTTWFWSRSRSSLWNKGETSGHVQRLVELRHDCDRDTLLALVEQTGPACHTGSRSCFDDRFVGLRAASGPLYQTVPSLYEVIAGRRDADPESSYTARLLAGGVSAIGAKVEEEAAEVVEAAASGDRAHTVYEAGDVVYHLLVLLASQGIEPADVWSELERRKK
jgi:phosphoribosyl-AMP cyclohydrolase / phosphoribosyl-ATP pyrophosphohydrolase